MDRRASALLPMESPTSSAVASPLRALLASSDYENAWTLFSASIYMAAAARRLARYGIGPRTCHVFRGLPGTGAGIAFACACEARLSTCGLRWLASLLAIAVVRPIRVLSGEALVRVRRDLDSLDIPDVEA